MRTVAIGVLGVLLGIPASYFFQAANLRNKLSLGDYLQHLPNLIEKMDRNEGVVTTLLITMLGFGVIGLVIGGLTDPDRHSTKQR